MSRRTRPRLPGITPEVGAVAPLSDGGGFRPYRRLCGGRSRTSTCPGSRPPTRFCRSRNSRSQGRWSRTKLEDRRPRLLRRQGGHKVLFEDQAPAGAGRWRVGWPRPRRLHVGLTTCNCTTDWRLENLPKRGSPVKAPGAVVMERRDPGRFCHGLGAAVRPQPLLGWGIYVESTTSPPRNLTRATSTAPLANKTGVQGTYPPGFRRSRDDRACRLSKAVFISPQRNAIWWPAHMDFGGRRFTAGSAAARACQIF